MPVWKEKNMYGSSKVYVFVDDLHLIVWRLLFTLRFEAILSATKHGLLLGRPH